MQLFDDLEDFGSFDDAVSGDVRDPYTELARMRREEPVQRLDMSGMPHEESKPVFMVYRHDEIAQVLRDNETFSSAIIIDVVRRCAGQARHARDGRARAPPLSRAGLRGVLAEGAGAPGGRAGRAGGQRADRPLRRTRARRPACREFTFPYPTQIIAGLLGLPREDYPQFQRWSISLLSITVNRERGVAASDGAAGVLRPDPRGAPATSRATT